MEDKEHKDCKHRRLCKTAKRGKWFDCQIAGKGCNCDSTKEYCKYQPYKSVVLVEYDPPQEEPINWEQMSNEQSMEIEHLQEQLQAKSDECEKKNNQIKILKEKTLIYHSCKTLREQNKILVEALELSISTLSNCKDEVEQFNKHIIDKTITVAKTALDRVKTTQTPSDLVQ